MESKGDANLLGKLHLNSGMKAASKAASSLESEAKSDAEVKADAKIDTKAELEACPLGKVEMPPATTTPTTPSMPAVPDGQMPNGPITIIDAHRSVHTESPLTAQLAQSVSLLNRLLLTMMGGGGMAMPAGVAPNMLP